MYLPFPSDAIDTRRGTVERDETIVFLIGGLLSTSGTKRREHKLVVAPRVMTVWVDAYVTVTI